MKRISGVLVCLLLALASGCEFFPVPTGTSAASLPPASVAATETGSPDASAPADTASAPTQAPADASAGAPTEAATEGPTQAATEAPSEAPTATPAGPAEGMIFPSSDTELLMWEDLIALPADKLDLARNEIFARAGYTFTNQKYIDYYGKLSWYQADPDFSESNFTDIQYANIHLIQAAEKAIKGQLLYIASGTKLDYDQDGELETLTYSAPDDYHMNVRLKDGGTTTPWDIECDTPSKKVYLGDIDFSDGKLDLFVDEFGPSDDYAVHVAGIKQNAFLNRTASEILPGQIGQLKADGKGKIATTKRMNILMTWFCKVSYKLDSAGKLAFVKQSSYSMGNFKCKAKVAIPTKKKADASSAAAFTIPAGADVTLVSTDDKKWINVKTSAGSGWIEMADTTTLADPNISAVDAFDGLNMAD